jgi:hypothetical protein
MAKLDSALPQRLEIEGTSGAAQVIEADNLAARDVIEEPVGERAPDKTANA